MSGGLSEQDLGYVFVFLTDLCIKTIEAYHEPRQTRCGRNVSLVSETLGTVY